MSEKFALFFNGGKDSTVLLHLIEQKIPNVLIVYIENDDEFPEMKEYVDTMLSSREKVLRYNNTSMKAVIEDITKCNGITHIYTGIRRTDPYGSKTDYIKETDSDWPRVYLVNPLLDWTYTDIWDYIFKNKLKYCSLYDKGYTSLGTTKNTIKNVFLLKAPNTSEYLPAYMLSDTTQERCGRF